MKVKIKRKKIGNKQELLKKITKKTLEQRIEECEKKLADLEEKIYRSKK